MYKNYLNIVNYSGLIDSAPFGSCSLFLDHRDQLIDPKTFLKGKKIRKFSPETIKILCCFEALLNDGELDPHSAIVSATSMGDFESVCELLRESWNNSQPYKISPGNIQNTIINSTAGISAINYALDGPNISICARELSFYEALSKTMAIAMSDQAKNIFLTSVEDFKGVYGISRRHLLNDENSIQYPKDTLATIFHFSTKNITADKILFVNSGRLFSHNKMDILLSNILDSLNVKNTEISYVCLWDATSNYRDEIDRFFSPVNIYELPKNAGYLMSCLGSWQLENLILNCGSGKLGIQIAIDHEGYYGIAIISKSAEYK
jgi:hypothetical protein